MTTSQSKSQVIFQRVGGGEEEQSPAHKSLAGNLVRGVYSFLVRCLIYPLVFSVIPLPTCSQSPQFLNLCRILFSSQYFYCEIKKHFFLLIQKLTNNIIHVCSNITPTPSFLFVFWSYLLGVCHAKFFCFLKWSKKWWLCVLCYKSLSHFMNEKNIVLSFIPELCSLSPSLHFGRGLAINVRFQIVASIQNDSFFPAGYLVVST